MIWGHVDLLNTCRLEIPHHLPVVLIWHRWISTHSPKLRSAFQSLHFQTDGDVRVEFRHWLCLQDHHCTTRALTDILL